MRNLERPVVSGLTRDEWALLFKHLPMTHPSVETKTKTLSSVDMLWHLNILCTLYSARRLEPRLLGTGRCFPLVKPFLTQHFNY